MRRRCGRRKPITSTSCCRSTSGRLNPSTTACRRASRRAERAAARVATLRTLARTSALRWRLPETQGVVQADDVSLEFADHTRELAFQLRQTVGAKRTFERMTAVEIG